jgi:hypothetical protein
MAVSAIVFWLLLQFNRAVRVMKNAADSPLGEIESAVMFHAKLERGLTMLQVVTRTRSLGKKIEGSEDDWAWHDPGGNRVSLHFERGKLRSLAARATGVKPVLCSSRGGSACTRFVVDSLLAGCGAAVARPLGFAAGRGTGAGDARPGRWSRRGAPASTTVAPAPDGGVWFTAQASGHLGWFDPKSGRTELIPLGTGSAPHGVIPRARQGRLDHRRRPRRDRPRRLARPGGARLSAAGGRALRQPEHRHLRRRRRPLVHRPERCRRPGGDRRAAA